MYMVLIPAESDQGYSYNIHKMIKFKACFFPRSVDKRVKLVTENNMPQQYAGPQQRPDPPKITRRLKSLRPAYFKPI